MFTVILPHAPVDSAQTDALADVAEIDELMSRGYETYDGVDEADLDAELAGLEDELAAEPAESLVGIPDGPGIAAVAPVPAAAASSAYPSYPAVPSTVPQVPAAPAAARY